MGYVLYGLPHVPSAANTLPVAGADDDMLARLAQAARVSVEVLQSQPDLLAISAQLRGDAAAKRALWPRLRALRRTLQ
jgi:hypothetical protein